MGSMTLITNVNDDRQEGGAQHRHFVARDMLNYDMPLETVQDVLGHRSIETTRTIYAISAPAKTGSG
jgi:integrase